MSSDITFTYQVTLSANSPMYSRGCSPASFYYEIYEIKVPEIRYYTIRGSSDFHTYGYIYKNQFNPLKPTENMIARDDHSDVFFGQFKLEIPLYVDTTYILVVTTPTAKKTGEIKINLLGVTNVTVKHISE